jgi:hypothetical protein
VPATLRAGAEARAEVQPQRRRAAEPCFRRHGFDRQRRALQQVLRTGKALGEQPFAGRKAGRVPEAAVQAAKAERRFPGHARQRPVLGQACADGIEQRRQARARALRHRAAG